MNSGLMTRPQDALPALPPQLAETRRQTVDEVVAELKRSPFFMTSLDDAGDEENPELEAFKALLYEDSRAENAANFREQGNENARARKWADAKDFFTKGLAALKMPRQDQDPTGTSEDMKEQQLREALLANRALCHLELENYRSCCKDCVEALSLSTVNVKVYYRLVKALLALRYLEEVTQVLKAARSVHPDEKAWPELQHQLDLQKQAQAKAEAGRHSLAQRKTREATVLSTALEARGIRIRRTKEAPDLQDAAIQLLPDPLSPTSLLAFPVLVLYPQHGQSDFIKAFGEEQDLSSHLEYLLPLPWDTDHLYSLNTIRAHIETANGQRIAWDRDTPLGAILSDNKVEIVDGLVKVYLTVRD